jgi:hypothetical protein
MADDDVRPARVQRAAFIADRLHVFTTKGCPGFNATVWRLASAGELGRGGARDGPRVARGGEYGAGKDDTHS